MSQDHTGQFSVTQRPQAPSLGAGVSSLRDPLKASRTLSTPQRKPLGPGGGHSGPHHYLPPPQEAGQCSPALLAPPLLGNAASTARGPFLQGTVNGYYS